MSLDSGAYVVEVDSTIGGSEYEVETDSEIDLTEGRRKRRKKKVSCSIVPCVSFVVAAC